MTDNADGVNNFKRCLLDIAKPSSDATALTEECSKLLARGAGDIEIYVPQLVSILKRCCLSDHELDHSLMCLWRVLGGAFLIGQRGTVTESAKAYFRPEIIKEKESDPLPLRGISAL